MTKVKPVKAWAVFSEFNEFCGAFGWKDKAKTECDTKNAHDSKRQYRVIPVTITPAQEGE